MPVVTGRSRVLYVDKPDADTRVGGARATSLTASADHRASLGGLAYQFVRGEQTRPATLEEGVSLMAAVARRDEVSSEGRRGG